MREERILLKKLAKEGKQNHLGENLGRELFYLLLKSIQKEKLLMLGSERCFHDYQRSRDLL
ncbi:MAG: hypothetical protein ACFFA7_11295 [Promethearchaeota archaeon]